jgi:hypothetical protein
MAFSAYSSTRRLSLCCSIVGDEDTPAAAPTLQALMLLALGLDGTSLLLAAAACLLLVLLLSVLGLFLQGLLLGLLLAAAAAAAACLLLAALLIVLGLFVVMFLQGLLLGLRTWKLSRLLRNTVSGLLGWLLPAVGLLGSRALSVWLLAGQLTCADFAGEVHLARRLDGLGAACFLVSVLAAAAAAADAEGSASAGAAASIQGRDSLLSFGVELLLHVLAIASFGVAVLLAGFWPAAAVPGAAGILEVHAAVLVELFEFFRVTPLPAALSLLLGEAFGLFCLPQPRLRCCCCRLLLAQADGLLCSSDMHSRS